MLVSAPSPSDADIIYEIPSPSLLPSRRHVRHPAPDVDPPVQDEGLVGVADRGASVTSGQEESVEVHQDQAVARVRLRQRREEICNIYVFLLSSEKL